MLKKPLFLLFIIAVIATSCSEYSKILKSKDTDLKYTKAVEYYEAKKYDKALPLFEELIPLMRLTAKAEDAYYYFSMCHYHTKQYYLAAYYLKNFAKTFPASKYAEECLYLSAICNVKNSPNWSLDQTETETAIQELQLFMNRYPNSPRRDTCNKIMDQLYHKLETKAFEAAYLYYKVENYKAASIALKSMLEEYPESRYKEEAMFLIVKSNYLLAQNSVDAKKLDRYSETIKSYHNFAALYKQSGYFAEAERIYKNSLEEIEKLNKLKEVEKAEKTE
jgi:outer membrane protein assembly factor BamD